MTSFDIIAVITMWNMYNLTDLTFREMKNACPPYYNSYKYFHLGLLSLCVGASLRTAFKYY